MKYQFITIDMYCLSDSYEETIDDNTLNEYIKPFSSEAICEFRKDWRGYAWKAEEKIYIWKKLET